MKFKHHMCVFLNKQQRQNGHLSQCLRCHLDIHILYQVVWILVLGPLLISALLMCILGASR